MTTDERCGLFYAAIAVFFFSTTPVLVRWGKPLSPYVITWGRLLVGAMAAYCLATLQGNRDAPMPPMSTSSPLKK